MGRAFATGATFVIAALIGLITSLVTTDRSVALWVALGVLVVGGAALQGWVTRAERRSGSRRVVASGAGSVAVRGNAREVRTRVRGTRGPAATDDGGETQVLGPGAVSIAGDAGLIVTDVNDTQGHPGA